MGVREASRGLFQSRLWFRRHYVPRILTWEIPETNSCQLGASNVDKSAIKFHRSSQACAISPESGNIVVGWTGLVSSLAADQVEGCHRNRGDASREIITC